MAIAMLVPLILMAIIVSFGVGFILNMLTKFWMSSGIAFILLLGYILFNASQGLKAFEWILIALMAIGSLSSAFAIRTLRNRGFRMFQ